MALGRRLLFLAASLGLIGQVAAQEDGDDATTLNLPSCESKCYNMTAGMKGCEADDYACTCDGFMVQFYPQYSSCMIESCAFSASGISAEELESMVCDLAGQSPGTPSSSSTTTKPEETTSSTSMPTSDSTGEPPAESTSPGSDEPTNSSQPTPVTGAGAGHIADSALYGVFWVGIMAVAAAGLV